MRHMLKKPLIIVMIFLTFHQGLFADSGSRRRNNDVSINPLMLFQYALPITYHRALSDGIAWGVGFVGKHNGDNYHGLGGAVSFKFYLSNKVFEDSWYVEPRVDLSYNSLNEKKYLGLTPSAIAGHSWVWPSGFTINLGFGVSYPIGFVDQKIFGSQKWRWGMSGIQPTGEFSLGWAW